MSALFQKAVDFVKGCIDKIIESGLLPRVSAQVVKGLLISASFFVSKLGLNLLVGDQIDKLVQEFAPIAAVVFMAMWSGKQEKKAIVATLDKVDTAVVASKVLTLMQVANSVDLTPHQAAQVAAVADQIDIPLQAPALKSVPMR